MRRVLFLIDGFNVYHALDSQPHYHKYKWLNYAALARCFILPDEQIVRILLFTAYAHWDPNKKRRHKLLIRALEANGVEVILGKFKWRDKKCPLCKQWYKTPEEKRTDVNIATQLFEAAVNDQFDVAIIIGGDSDLVPAVKAVKKTFPQKKIGLVIPIGRHAKELAQVCDFRRKMKETHLKLSQLPNTVTIDPAKGVILRRPPSWT